MKRILLTVLAAASALAAQPNYNLDFETVTRSRPRDWTTFNPGYLLDADDTTAVQGKYSMRLRSTNTTGTLGSTGTLLSAAELRGKRVKISGWIKTADIAAPGYADLWFYVEGTGGRQLSYDSLMPLGLRGSLDWKRYEYERVVGPDAQRVILGMNLIRQGTAWFDDLRVEVDGVPLTQGPAPVIAEPTAQQLDWIRQNAFAFRTERAGSGFDDLQPLKQLVGNARVVGLGEATHGTAEFFRMKHRVLEYLANEMGFTIFNIEANMPEAYRLNDYVLTGRGDARRLIAGMYFWTWRTEEVFEMVEWMRAFNASGKGRVQFTGNDMQTAAVAVALAQDFIAKADPAYVDKAKEAYALVLRGDPLPALTAANLATFQAASRAANEVRVYLESRYADYVKTMPMAEVEWGIQNARVAEQAAFVKIGGPLHRDEMMALNTDWVLQQNPGAKMVLWAHNYHVSRQTGAQGSYLSRWYGDSYVALGFSFGEGMYSAVDFSVGRVRSDNVAVTPFLGSAEYVFRATGLPRFILDLRKAKRDNSGAWLLGANEARELGAGAGDGFLVRDLPALYDAVIYFDQTTPSVIFNVN